MRACKLFCTSQKQMGTSKSNGFLIVIVLIKWSNMLHDYFLR